MFAICFALNLAGRVGLVAVLAVAALPQAYAGPYGDCEVLFVAGSPPKAPSTATALCEAREDAVYFATGYSKQQNHGYWSAYRLDEEQAVEVVDNPLPRPHVIFHQNPKLKSGGYVQPRHDSYTGSGF